jgi:hypothetical protein
METVFISCKAVAGGYVAVGDDAAMSGQSAGKGLQTTSRALNLLGSVVSAIPLLSNAAPLVDAAAAATAAVANARRTSVAATIGRAHSLSEFMNLTTDLAEEFTNMYGEQLDRLARPTTAVPTPGHMRTSPSNDTDEDAVSGHVLLCESDGAALKPFAQVVGEFVVAVMLAELENAVGAETIKELHSRLMKATLERPCLEAKDENEDGSVVGKLVRRALGKVRRSAIGGPPRAGGIGLQVQSSDGGVLEMWSLLDMLTRPGLRSKVGSEYESDWTDSKRFGWMLGDETQAVMRRLMKRPDKQLSKTVVVVTTPQAMALGNVIQSAGASPIIPRQRLGVSGNGGSRQSSRTLQ